MELFHRNFIFTVSKGENILKLYRKNNDLIEIKLSSYIIPYILNALKLIKT